MAQRRIEQERRMKILADYTLEGSYRAAARKNSVSPDTVRRIVRENPDMVKVADTQKNARARDLMSYMQGKAISEITEFNGLPIARLRELAEADKDGRVVVLPCKLGDRLYEVTGRKTISVYKVKAIRVELFSLFIEWDIVEGFVWQSLSGINAGEIGKTVFLTREEAEKALEAMK